MKYEIEFFGHENIRSNHKNTIEITKESHLTPRGDCIVGVSANSSCKDLPEELKNKLKNPENTFEFLFKVEGIEFSLKGKGHPNLTLTHQEDIVLRKSDFTCPRTLSVKCDKASDLVPREMVTKLQNPKTKGLLIISTD
ncbi:DUF371 domain-containing protein [Nitrosopumilus sp. Nsub]|uniref:DUF371 domain-containing protein n=1 Tax=Nitrosopumilus sp. Nsub TaxID=1776294 RepID=UPI00082E5B6B|nr:DUF371 domain-containing protein [Nitrosopumilus sp. Nsub]